MKRLKGKPFVMLGINSDQDRKTLNAVSEKEQLTWPNFWDGDINGPIATQWQVSTRPTMYLLDQKGIIRYTDTSGGDLDIEAVEAAVDELMKKAADK